MQSISLLFVDESFALDAATAAALTIVVMTTAPTTRIISMRFITVRFLWMCRLNYYNLYVVIIVLLPKIILTYLKRDDSSNGVVVAEVVCSRHSVARRGVWSMHGRGRRTAYSAAYMDYRHRPVNPGVRWIDPSINQWNIARVIFVRMIDRHLYVTYR